MLRDEINTVLTLKDIISNRLVGQTQAIDTIAKHIVTYRANLDEPGKPIGVFLLAGPSGVGKTETAFALADTLYGGERNLVTINMSEYQEAYTVSSLKGSPPGYVGYGEGGVLTEAVRRNPYSVVLLDEIEKAHPDVMELFYQVFDKGTLEDAEGIQVDFKNTVILMTTNMASETIMAECKNPKKLPTAKKVSDTIRPELSAHFKPALLGRMTVVPYYPLNHDEISEIVKLKLDRIKNRFENNHNADFSYDKEIIKFITDRCDDPDSGARNIDYIINQNLLPQLSAEVLKHIADETPFGSIKVSIKRGEFMCDFEASKIANKA
jgi:type VI secretion system protein VasG